MVPITGSLQNSLWFLKSYESDWIGSSACRILMRLWRLSFIGLLVVGISVGWHSESAGEDNRGVRTAEEAVSSVDFGTYYALIIGINEYSKWPPLMFAERDAIDIHQILTTRYGFAPERVTPLIGKDATRSRILRELRDKLESLGENDNLLVYYAGHGQLDPLTENGYWIPVEGGLRDEADWIAFPYIQTLLTGRKVKAKSILVLTDSCYGGALARSGPTPGHWGPTDENYRKYEQYLAGLAKKRSRQIITSGGYEEVRDRSPFADLLKRALEDNPYPMIDLESLFYDKIYQQLKFIGQQLPRHSRLVSGPEDDGQFVLLQKEAVAVPRPSPEPPEPAPQLEPKAVLTVRSNVNGDAVYIDGQAKGSTRLDLELEPGKHKVRVEKEGYHPYEQQVELTRGENVTVRAELKPIAPEAVIDYFEADPPHITRGQTSTLRWRTQHAEDVEISGIGGVSSSGSRTIDPQQSTSYVLIARNKEGRQTEREIRVSVEIADPKIVSFRASPSSIRRGESSTLRWKTENAEAVHIGGIGRVGLSDSQVVNPSETVSYTLIAENERGLTVDKEITVVVKAPRPRILSFHADRSTINRGETSNLSWRVSDAAEVSINGKTVRPSGSTAISPSETNTYELRAKNEEDETVTEDVTIRVILPPPEIVRFEATSPIIEGGTSTLKWETRNSEQVEIRGVGRFGPSGETKVMPNATTTYTLSAGNGSGPPVERKATVTVNPSSVPNAPRNVIIRD